MRGESTQAVPQHRASVPEASSKSCSRSPKERPSTARRDAASILQTGRREAADEMFLSPQRPSGLHQPGQGPSWGASPPQAIEVAGKSRQNGRIFPLLRLTCVADIAIPVRSGIVFHRRVGDVPSGEQEADVQASPSPCRRSPHGPPRWPVSPSTDPAARLCWTPTATARWPFSATPGPDACSACTAIRRLPRRAAREAWQRRSPPSPARKCCSAGGSPIRQRGILRRTRFRGRRLRRGIRRLPDALAAGTGSSVIGSSH